MAYRLPAWSSSRLATQRGRAISWVDLAKVIEKERGEKITINIGDADILKEKIEEEDDKLSAGRCVGTVTSTHRFAWDI